MIRRVRISVIVLLVATQIQAQSVTITEAAGWLESAFAKWQPVDSAISYNVYYSGEGSTDQRVDDPLIRTYGSYCRVDVIGLKPGSYTIKVEPVFPHSTGAAANTMPVTVMAHDRAGFAFSGNRLPGAYKADGTPKADAVVVYISEHNKDSVSLVVTGASSNPCKGLQAILDGFKKGKDNRPLIVRLVGQITDPAYMLNGDIVIENNNSASGYITFEGVGADAVADGWGLRIKGASNVEVRNIGFMNCNSSEGDNIGLQQDNDHIWVHNCDLFYGNAGSDEDQIKGDGALDCKLSTYITFSYNHFWDNGKCNLLGLSESDTLNYFITYHHNWYDHSDSRHPRVRFFSAHVYNNYYDGNAKYGVGATEGASVFVEANYFRNCKYPMVISMQGSDVYNQTTSANDYTTMPTFSKEEGGSIKAYNNYITGAHRFVAYGSSGYPNPTIDFDAYVAASRTETLSSSVVSYHGHHAYNNFDTNLSLMYTYAVDSPVNAKNKVTTYAGRIAGGDFTWTFDNSVDDVSSSVITGLKTALTAYKTTLVSIQGDSVYQTTPNDSVPVDPDTVAIDTAALVHNFTESGKTSSFYTIIGNLSTSKGTVMYSGLTLTQCLKIESSTSIVFTSAQEGTLTLVFNETFTGEISINGTSYTAVSGIVTATIPPGGYTLTKVDAAYMYYLKLSYVNNGERVPTITSTTPSSRCGEGSVTLAATASAGNVNWYAAETGGSAIATGVSFTTPTLSVTTIYYVDATDNAITTSSRTAVVATVKAVPTIVSATSAVRCGAGSVILNATASAGTLAWYEVETGGVAIGSGTGLLTPSISNTTTYYVDATYEGCTTATRTPVLATVTATPVVQSTVPAARCDEGWVTLGATASSGTIQWFEADTGEIILGTGPTFNTPEIASSRTYYAQAVDNGCISAARTAVIATVNPTPFISTTAPAERLGYGSLTLAARASEGIINWYAESSGGSSLGTGEHFTTPNLQQSTSYFVDATANGCTSQPRSAIVATVHSATSSMFAQGSSLRVSVSPNPVTSVLTLHSDANIVYVDVYNAAGVLVTKVKRHQNQVDVNDFEQGFYLLLIFTSRGIASTSIVKQ